MIIEPSDFLSHMNYLLGILAAMVVIGLMIGGGRD